MKGRLLVICAVLLSACGLALSQACNDASSYRFQCRGWKNAGYCLKTSTWNTFMRTNCKKTCGYCSTPIVKKVVKALCADNSERSNYCGTWRRYGYCLPRASFYRFMQLNCAKTCGFCTVKTTPRPTPKPTTTPKPATKPPVKACSNTPKYDGYCPTWKNNGFCKQGSEWQAFMKDHCRQTCKFCDSVGTTTKPKKECGLPGGRIGRIIGGKDAVPNYWRWQVALTDADTFFCGGSLIHPRWVLTAAHCTYYKSQFIDSIKVILGEHDRTKDEGKEVTIGVEKIINHADYDRPTLKHDIALVKLKEDAPLNDYIGLVCLPPAGKNVPVKKMCTASGWGKVKHPGTSVPILQVAKLPIVEKTTCAKQNSNPGPAITDQMVCAGYGPASKISGCHGDSGGPLVCENDNYRYVLEGAVSWGSTRCDTKDKYTVFTRVSEYIKWIEDNMKQ